MLVSCICVCHDKPDITHEAIESVVNQSYNEWELILIDSGVLYDSGYYNKFHWINDSRIKLIKSHETEEIKKTKAMAPWCFNEAFRNNWVKGDLIVYLCDDDILYPNAFDTFVSYSKFNPQAKAFYASQDVGIIHSNGIRSIVGERRADLIGGKCVNGKRMDCVVDYLQFCHKTDLLKLFNNQEYWPEDKSSESHADGVFMEKCGSLVPIFPIDIKVSQNRRTPKSTYGPSK
jgi:glycosyltransferase involved in cell wall biosynthesis